MSKETYTKDRIVAVLNSERKLKLNSTSDVVICEDNESDDGCQHAYIMNVDDNFNVTIKNTNITLATVIYNMVTANTLDSNTRIYVNYGGAILSNKWQGNIDYSKMKHDEIKLNKFKEIEIFSDKITFKADVDSAVNVPEGYNGQYILSLDVKPNNVTDLREKGALIVADYSKYNFAAGNKDINTQYNMLSVSVGLNGVSLIAHTVKRDEVSLGVPFGEYKIVSTDKAKTTSCQMEKTYISEGEDGQQIITKAYEAVPCNDIVDTTDITDYKNISVKYLSEDKFNIVLEGKEGTNNVKVEVSASTGTKLSNLNFSKNNPSGTIAISGKLTDVTTNSGKDLKYYITISNSVLKIVEESEEPTKVSDYSSAHIKYVDGEIELTMTSQKSNVSSFTKQFVILNNAHLLQRLNRTINLNETLNGEINFKSYINARSTDITGNIMFDQNSMSISAGQSISEEMTILSYPVTINEYANIRIEWEETDNGKYIALLYINNEKVDESIELDVIPKVNVIGKTIIGNEERFFDGSIKNAKIYALNNK